jgi:2-polyprenyl-6-methoxyphenol hydroxylase-like FAD-dependent oxidoreductase
MAEETLLIVGAGPTGLTAAVELARRGVMPRIIDGKSSPLPLSRAVGINARSLTLLEASGVAERLLAEGVRVQRARIHDQARAIAELRLDRQDFKYNFMLCLPQDSTEAILLERFKELGGDVEFGVSLESLSRRDEKALVTLKHAGEQRIEEAEYDTVLGADGAHSRVREAVKLPYVGIDLAGAWGIADVDSAAWPYDDQFCGFILPGGRVVVVIPIGKDRYRVVANRTKALELVPGGMAVDRLRREADFDIAVRQVPSYRQDSVFLAGDAAHCHSPVGGRGMNLGIADAVSFAGRLAADDLDGYSAERHAHGQAAIAASERGRRALTAQSRLGRLLVRSVIRTIGNATFLQKRLARLVLDI